MPWAVRSRHGVTQLRVATATVLRIGGSLILLRLPHEVGKITASVGELRASGFSTGKHAKGDAVQHLLHDVQAGLALTGLIVNCRNSTSALQV